MLPAEPYRCLSTPVPLLPTFSSAIVCNATIHDDYDGAGDSDYAETEQL